jgi:hypothetical protein
MPTVAFSDFYSGYEGDIPGNPITKYFYDSPIWRIVKITENPDLIVASTWGKNHLKYPGVKKIMWAAENMCPDQPWPAMMSWEGVKWALVSNHQNVPAGLPESMKFYYLPYAGIHCDMSLVRSQHEENIQKEKTRFCCFISTAVGRAEGYKLRYDFFRYLSTRYKYVDSGGKTLNNIGHPVPRDKHIEWISQYKFMICFENSQGAGYITEKIFHAYAAGAIPIYWGDRSAFDMIREEACIFYTTPEETLAKIKYLDENPEAYIAMQREPLLREGEAGKKLEREYLISLYDTITAELN